MKHSIFKGCIVAAFLVAVTACASSPVNIEPIESYSNVLEQLASKFNTPVKHVESEYGVVKYVLIKSEEFDEIVNFAQAIESSCKTAFTNTSLPYVYSKGLFDPTQYGLSKPDLNLMIEENGKGNRLFHAGPTPRDVKEYAGELLQAEGVSSHNYAYSCLENKRFKGVIIDAIGSVKNQNYHYIAYLDESFLDRRIPAHFTKAILYINNVTIPERKRSDEARRIRKEKDAMEIKQFESEMAQEKEIWTNRLLNDYTLGAEVCTYKNKYGNIEQVSGNKVKVLWAVQVTDKPNGWAFGNKRQYEGNSFNYSHLDKITWVDKDKISYCDFNL